MQSLLQNENVTKHRNLQSGESEKERDCGHPAQDAPFCTKVTANELGKNNGIGYFRPLDYGRAGETAGTPGHYRQATGGRPMGLSEQTEINTNLISKVK